MKKPSTSRAVLLAAGVTLFVGILLHLARDPAVVMLMTDGPASWIRPDEDFDVGSHQHVNSTVYFFRDVNVPASSASGVLLVRALRRFRFALDNKPLFDSGPDLSRWKTQSQVPLPTSIAPGIHRFEFQVQNENGPALLRVRCDALGIASDSTWQASRDGQHWIATALAQRLWEPSVLSIPVASSLDRMRFVLVPAAFLIGAIVSLKSLISPDLVRRLRWFLLLALLILGFNNCFKLGILCGYDAQAHYEYIQFVATHGSLPRPDAGWQFFQSPLYYVVSALLSRLLLAIGIQGQRMMMLLRCIPIVSAAMLVEISYRAARRVFPGRGDLQLIATVIGGLIPVNIYMGQTVGNEPMAAAYCGVLLLICLRLISDSPGKQPTRWVLLAGAALGLATLTKISAILWSVAIVLAVATASARQPRFLHRLVTETAISIGAALMVCQWYFVRNFLVSGKAVYLGSPSAAVSWWQDPGYRTPDKLWEFGHLFARPLFNVMGGFWDCLYATTWGDGVSSGQLNWNFHLMSIGLWLGLIPTLAIIKGMCGTLPGGVPALPALKLCAAITCCYIAAELYTYLTLPIYGCAKGSYLMNVTPCMGLLAAYGYDLLPSSRLLRAMLLGLIVCSAVTSYATFFAVS